MLKTYANTAMHTVVYWYIKWYPAGHENILIVQVIHILVIDISLNMIQRNAR